MSDDTVFYPPLDPDRRRIEGPVTEVTVLEDRAQVRRRAEVSLVEGLNRLVLLDVAPILQDVSLRAEVIAGAGEVADARVRRAMRVRRPDKPESIRALEAQIEDLKERFFELHQDKVAAQARYARLESMLAHSAAEIPLDAAWGRVNAQVWQDAFESFSSQLGALRLQALDKTFAQEDLQREVDVLAARRAILDSPEKHFMAAIEIDVMAKAAGPATIAIDYAAPNAMWRPAHTARLVGASVVFTASAAVWQNTGEDWSSASLSFSTARSSLGTEPPLLSDDLLQTARRSEEVVIEAREVAVQTASVGGGGGGASAPQPSAVDLDGVDDGGDVQNLKPDGPCTVPSDGRPVFVPLFTFEAPAKVDLVSMPELSLKVFLKSVQANTGRHPILAGPVELIRHSGPVGWSEVLFVAPGERFALSFGPQDGVRMTREARDLKDEIDRVDKWRKQRFEVRLFVSNLEDLPQTVTVTERIPVAEIEHVKVSILDKETDPKPALDRDGFCTWSVSLEGHARRVLRLTWELATAPGVISRVRS